MRVMGVGLAAGLALGVWQSGCAGGSCPECTAAVELCDGLDNDGDGAVDEDAADALEWFTDADGDGYGGS